MDNTLAPQTTTQTQENHSLAYLNNPHYKEFKKQATVALICGIISIFIFGFILGIVAIVNALPAKRNLKSINAPTSTATTGLVLGILGLIGWVVAIVMFM